MLKEMEVKPRARIETITPKIAGKLVAQGDPNRPKRDRHIEFLAQEIISGRWKVNGEAIVIADSGRVLDGQHRLAAVVLANAPIRTFVVRGVPESFMDSINQGITRQASDMFTLSGEKNGALLAATLRWVKFYLDGCIQKHEKVGIGGLKEILKSHSEVRESVNIVGRRPPRYMPPSVLSAVHYLASIVGHNGKADAFADGLITGQNLPKGSPILHLRDRLERNLHSAAKLGPKDVLALTIKGFNAFASEKPLGRLQVPSAATDKKGGEAFPRILGDEVDE